MEKNALFDQYIVGLDIRSDTEKRAKFFFKATQFMGEIYDVSVLIFGKDYIEKTIDFPMESQKFGISPSNAASFSAFLQAFTENDENAAITFYMDKDRQHMVCIRRIPGMEEMGDKYGIGRDGALAGIKFFGTLMPDEEQTLDQFIEYLYNPYTDISE